MGGGEASKQKGRLGQEPGGESSAGPSAAPGSALLRGRPPEGSGGCSRDAQDDLRKPRAEGKIWHIALKLLIGRQLF